MKYARRCSSCCTEQSPPSRGAWIEIMKLYHASKLALGRPPRGGRGLKFSIRPYSAMFKGVAPLAGGVD